jgi:hypothetical protein
MIGAGLGGVSEELAHHLGLEPAAAAKATMLTSVMKDLPAGVAGLERFDVIVAVNGSDDASPDALREALRNAEPGSKVTLGVRRGAETKTVECTVAAFDGAKLATMEPIQVEGFEVGDFGVGGFDARDFLVPGMPMELDLEIEDLDEPGNGGAMGLFIGPDGQRREFRVPMPPAPRARAGGDRAQAEAMERVLSELNRRMDMLADRLDAPRMQREDAQPNERGEPRGRGPGAENAEVNERLRRLEERLDAVMRELERANAERANSERANAERGPRR